MSDDNSTGSGTPSNDLADELRALGNNIRAMFTAAWESPERKKIQGEIESGLADLGNTLSKAASDFAASPTGQSLKADVDEIGEKIRSGEVESRLRQDIIEALRTANTEIKKAFSSWKSASPTEPVEQPPADEQ